MRITLSRFAFGPMGTFGVLEGEDLSLYCLECPWLDNEVGKSCIPIGTYPMTKHGWFKKRGAQWRVDDVPERSAILFHVGNTIDDLQGCIALGMSLGYISHKWAVSNSTHATTMFNAVLFNLKYAELHVRIDYDAWRRM